MKPLDSVTEATLVSCLFSKVEYPECRTYYVYQWTDIQEFDRATDPPKYSIYAIDIFWPI